MHEQEAAMAERLRKKAELQKQNSRPATFQDSLAKEMERKKSLKSMTKEFDVIRTYLKTDASKADGIIRAFDERIKALSNTSKREGVCVCVCACMCVSVRAWVRERGSESESVIARLGVSE